LIGRDVLISHIHSQAVNINSNDGRRYNPGDTSVTGGVPRGEGNITNIDDIYRKEG